MAKQMLIAAISFFIGIVLLLLALTYYLYTYNLVHGCRQYPNVWCWTDWECSGESEPARQYPAATFYGCDGTRPRDTSYCVDAPPGTPGCECSFASSPDGEMPPGCTCNWDTPMYGECGRLLCNGGDVQNCNE